MSFCELGELVELLDWFRAAFSGWRYLFSPSHRQRVHDVWRERNRWRICWDIVCGAVGIAFSLFLAYFMVSLFAGWNWMAELLK